jgi:protein-S-isoprenylcysteine O-methyltransferase Ste14
MMPKIQLWFYVSGAAGFGLTVLYDLQQLQNRLKVRRVTSLAGAVLVSAATAGLYLIAFPPDPVWWVLLPGFSVIAFSALMMIRSTMQEIPHNEIAAGNDRKLIDTGSYGITRHPGFMWYFILTSTTAALYRHPGVAKLAASLLGMELIVVTLEDRLIFPRLFPDYPEYRRRVPMLFPFRFCRRGR